MADMEVSKESETPKSEEQQPSDNGAAKRPREEAEDDSGEKKAKTEVVDIGPKTFTSSVELFEYLFKILHTWPANLSLNKYEHLVLMELLKKGHVEAEKKIGGKEVKAFQIRFHPQYKSKCFFLVRDDDSAEDFSFRKCVDHILPLPEDFQPKQHVNKALGGRGGRGGRGRH